MKDIVPDTAGQLKHIRQLLVETLQRMESKEKAINTQFEQTVRKLGSVRREC